MLYLEYEEYKNKYLETQRKYDELLSKKERIIAKSKHEADLTEIDGLIVEIKSVLDDREQLLRQKKSELEISKDITDQVYMYRYIEHKTVKNISYRVYYSVSQVYRILDEIKETLNNSQHEKK